jgi:hypothetical protein
MIITMKEEKIKEIFAKCLGYEMREFNPDYFSVEDLEEKIKELGLNPQKILEDYEEEEKKKQEEEYNKYFGEDEDEEEEDDFDDEYY